MANIKFSGFTEVTSISAVQEIVGYNGTQNVRITPANFLSSLPGGPFLPLTGGTMTGDLKLNDAVVAKFGTGDDLRIQHTGNQSYIQNYTGDLQIQNLADDKDILFRSDDGAGGIATYFYLDGGAVETGFTRSTRHFDNVGAYFGDSADLQIFHDSTNSYISDIGTGNLFITSNGASVQINKGTTENMAEFIVDGAVKLYYDSAQKLATTNTGVEVAGNIDLADGATRSIIGPTNSNLIIEAKPNTAIEGLFFQINGSDKLSIVQDGNVGIGTTSPTTWKLTVDSDDVYAASFDTSSNVGLTINGNNATAAQLLGYSNSASTYNDLDIRSNSTPGSGIYIDGSESKVGISTTAPSQKLHVAGNARVTGAYYDSSNTPGTSGQVLSSTGGGTDWIDAAAGGGVDGKSSVYVAGVGTPTQNGTALINGYTAAVAKIQNISTVNSKPILFSQNLGSGNYELYESSTGDYDGATLNTNYTANYGTTPAQTLVFRITSIGFQFIVLITDTSGNPLPSLTLDNSGFPILSTQTIPAHLIIGPGQYDLPSSLVINDLVSVVSLTGKKDVNITGYDVQVSSGANAKSTYICGLNLQENKFIVDTNLNNITVVNVEARASNSFDSATGGGNLSGTFIDCFSGSESFASTNGANASGTFIRCDAKRPNNTAGFSFGGGSGTTSGYFDSCGNLSGSNQYGGGYANFSRSGNLCNGYFYYCKGQNQSFASSCGTVNARFINCISTGSSSFGDSTATNNGKYYYCVGGSSSFGSNPQNAANTTQAQYNYCIANGEFNFGSNFSGTTAQSTYTGCIASANSFGQNVVGSPSTDGKLFNCQLTGGTFAAVGATGKIRNCIDNTFTLINLG